MTKTPEEWLKAFKELADPNAASAGAGAAASAPSAAASACFTSTRKLV